MLKVGKDIQRKNPQILPSKEKNTNVQVQEC
jgi:hypothetical protein